MSVSSVGVPRGLHAACKDAEVFEKNRYTRKDGREAFYVTLVGHGFTQGIFLETVDEFEAVPPVGTLVDVTAQLLFDGEGAFKLKNVRLVPQRSGNVVSPTK